MTWFRWIVLALAAGLLGLFAYMLTQPKDEFVESAMVGKPIPAFDLPPAVPDDVAAFLAAYGNPFSRIGKDDISAVQLSIGSSGVPETFVIDGKGVITYQHIGDIRDEHVSVLLAELREAGAS